MPGIRVPAGAAAVAALAVFASLNSYQVSQQVSARFPDAYGVAAAAGRMDGALQMIPPAAVIGYLSDLPFDQPGGAAGFMAAQHAVAPRALVNDKSQGEWVLGNFAHPGDFAALGAEAGLTMVRDFGNGVVVYRRAKP